MVISRKARLELVGAVAARYAASTKSEKARILDEFVAIAGYHRKHGIRLIAIEHGLVAVQQRPQLRNAGARRRRGDDVMYPSLGLPPVDDL